MEKSHLVAKVISELKLFTGSKIFLEDGPSIKMVAHRTPFSHWPYRQHNNYGYPWWTLAANILAWGQPFAHLEPRGIIFIKSMHSPFCWIHLFHVPDNVQSIGKDHHCLTDQIWDDSGKKEWKIDLKDYQHFKPNSICVHMSRSLSRLANYQNPVLYIVPLRGWLTISIIHTVTLRGWLSINTTHCLSHS